MDVKKVKVINDWAISAFRQQAYWTPCDCVLFKAESGSEIKRRKEKVNGAMSFAVCFLEDQVSVGKARRVVQPRDCFDFTVKLKPGPCLGLV
jgi:hypothetical protein